eukprot:Mrub_05372.p1 GENE.Mrub_05372~~Mrub_05372.p1  ORF type:complete len:372 (-),score=59.45 Mrub_05372:24-1094(-)
MIKDKVESVKADLYELHSKSQNRIDRSHKSLTSEMDSLKNAYSLKIDESREFISQELKRNNDEFLDYLDKFKIEHINLMYKDFTEINKTIDEMRNFMKKMKNDLENNDQLLEERIIKNHNSIEIYNSKILKPSIELEEKLENHSDKLTEIESRIYSNGNIIRDIIKKLIYTIETSFISGKNYDKLKSIKELHQNNQSVLSLSSPTQFKEPELTRDELESVFLKRLDFLKTLLDEEIKATNKNSFNYNSMSSQDLFNSGRIIFNTPKNVSQDTKNYKSMNQNKSFSNADISIKLEDQKLRHTNRVNDSPVVHVAKIKSKYSNDAKNRMSEDRNAFHNLKIFKSEQDSNLKLVLPKIN